MRKAQFRLLFKREGITFYLLECQFQFVYGSVYDCTIVSVLSEIRSRHDLHLWMLRCSSSWSRQQAIYRLVWTVCWPETSCDLGEHSVPWSTLRFFIGSVLLSAYNSGMMNGHEPSSFDGRTWIAIMSHGTIDTPSLPITKFAKLVFIVHPSAAVGSSLLSCECWTVRLIA